MNAGLQVAIGLAFVAVGAALVLAFPDTELWWFRGQPLGVVLALIGAVDLVEAAARRRR